MLVLVFLVGRWPPVATWSPWGGSVHWAVWMVNSGPDLGSCEPSKPSNAVAVLKLTVFPLPWGRNLVLGILLFVVANFWCCGALCNLFQKERKKKKGREKKKKKKEEKRRKRRKKKGGKQAQFGFSAVRFRHIYLFSSYKAQRSFSKWNLR